MLGVVLALVALVALGDLGLRAALHLETRWDAFGYHVPFAALRAGIKLPYSMNDGMFPYYQGFPPLPELLQGLLWRVTGTINATGVVNWLAFVGFLAYCHFVLRIRFWLVALIALTAPMVIIQSATNYVDLFGNSLLAAARPAFTFTFTPSARPARSSSAASPGWSGWHGRSFSSRRWPGCSSSSSPCSAFAARS